MDKKYPNTVCINCLKEAVDDTFNYENRICNWGNIYSCYDHTCEVCGVYAECTETSDAGYPTFKYLIPRIRAKKIKKIIEKL